MNPTAAGMWNNPPPPGIDEDPEEPIEKPSRLEIEAKSINQIDLKNPECVEHETHKSRDRHSHRKRSHSRSRHKSKSKSRDCDRKRKYKSRSRSRRRHRKSRSRSRGHHKHRSGSRSPSHDKNRYKHKDKKNRHSSARYRYSRSSSRSSSRSRNRKHHYSKSSRKSRTYSRSPSSEKNEYTDAEIKEEDKTEEEMDVVNKNAFKNDGSFFELYKKMQEEQQKSEAAKAEATASEMKKPSFGKRRGGRVLKTGVVVKTKNSDETEGSEPQDPWSIYLKEVKRYKEACCDDDSKTRPLVK